MNTFVVHLLLRVVIMFLLHPGHVCFIQREAMPLQRRVEFVTKLGLADLLSAKEFCSIAMGAHGKPRMQVRKVQVLLRLHY